MRAFGGTVCLVCILFALAQDASADTLTVTTTPASDGRVADGIPPSAPNGTGDQVLQGENTPQPQRVVSAPFSTNLRLLLEFPITGLPAFAVIDSVTLQLRFTQVHNPTRLMHLTTAEEGQVTTSRCWIRPDSAASSSSKAMPQPRLNQSQIGSPALLVLMGDGRWAEAWHPAPVVPLPWHRAGDSYNLAFMDTHVEFVRIRKGMHVTLEYTVIPFQDLHDDACRCQQ
jgi:hypothetical protein